MDFKIKEKAGRAKDKGINWIGDHTIRSNSFRIAVLLTCLPTAINQITDANIFQAAQEFNAIRQSVVQETQINSNSIDNLQNSFERLNLHGIDINTFILQDQIVNQLNSLVRNRIYEPSVIYGIVELYRESVIDITFENTQEGILDKYNEAIAAKQLVEAFANRES